MSHLTINHLFCVTMLSVMLGCSSAANQVAIADPTAICEQILTPRVAKQAARLGVTPAELAHTTCEAATLAARIALNASGVGGLMHIDMDSVAGATNCAAGAGGTGG